MAVEHCSLDINWAASDLMRLSHLFRLRQSQRGTLHPMQGCFSGGLESRFKTTCPFYGLECLKKTTKTTLGKGLKGVFAG